MTCTVHTDATLQSVLAAERAHDTLLLFHQLRVCPCPPPVHTTRGMAQLRRLTLLFAHGSCSKLNPKALTVGICRVTLARSHVPTLHSC